MRGWSGWCGWYGRFKGIRTLHPLLATVYTPASRPVIATVRMRRGKAADSACDDRPIRGSIQRRSSMGTRRMPVSLPCGKDLAATTVLRLSA
ncbi:hypothetical protein [Streptomyces sp. OE57]|uniref:hypothetical protein n=1 Tax=Streptomyces lacaronensis TaxID=3379885 RepID=UPI0039B79245